MARSLTMLGTLLEYEFAREQVCHQGIRCQFPIADSAIREQVIFNHKLRLKVIRPDGRLPLRQRGTCPQKDLGSHKRQWR
jgi:hypothetical protein